MDKIASILRHWFTLAATLATAWLVGMLALDADKQAELTKAITELVGPLVIIGTLVVTAGWRIALAWILKIFRNGSGELDNGGPSGGAGLLLMIGTMAALGTALPSCSSTEWPVTGSIMYRDPNSGAKGGLTFSPGSAPVASLKVPIYDPQTGKMIGLADLQTNLAKVDRKSGK